jgi:hypothetical protein
MRPELVIGKLRHLAWRSGPWQGLEVAKISRKILNQSFDLLEGQLSKLVLIRDVLLAHNLRYAHTTLSLEA